MYNYSVCWTLELLWYLALALYCASAGHLMLLHDWLNVWVLYHFGSLCKVYMNWKLICVIFLMSHILWVSASVGPGTECMSWWRYFGWYFDWQKKAKLEVSIILCAVYNWILVPDGSATIRGYGTVVARLLCMQKVLGSIPSISKWQYSNGHVFDSRWVLTTHL